MYHISKSVRMQKSESLPAKCSRKKITDTILKLTDTLTAF